MIGKRFVRLMILGLVLMWGLLACQSGGVAESTAVSPTEAVTAAAEVAPTATSEPLPTDTTEPTSEPEAAPTETPAEEPTEAPTEEPTATAEPTVSRNYEIVSEESEVRFFIDEELFGEPKTVVGRTALVTGEIIVDLNNPSEAQVGTIEINARDLSTDSSFRNRALRNQILESGDDAYQFITFTATMIEGLPAEPAVIGESIVFDMTGDLQIRDITNSVTFAITATAVSEIQLSGSGSVIVLRSDYDLNIPSVRGVANVADEVRLEIDFVAAAAE